MTKLLNRPLKAFTIYSLIILLVSIPVYFFVVDYIWLDELDEKNEIIKDHIEESFGSLENDEKELLQVINNWNSLQPGTKIKSINNAQVKADSVYEITKSKLNSDDGELERYRVLQSDVRFGGEPYRITVETNVEEADETLMAIATVTFVFFVLLILGFILLNRRIAKNSWQAFYSSLTSLRAFDLTKDQQLQLAKTDIEEFQQLNNSLQQLVNQNVRVYHQQKSFTENASHELQTPIALLKSRIDILLQEATLTPELAKLVHSIELPLARLSRINKNMLLLAKVENKQFEERKIIDLKAVIESCLNFFEDYFQEKTLTLQTKFEGDVKVDASPFLLETMLNNLISNAIRHTAADGTIKVELSNKLLQLSNSGKTKLQSEQLFKRFAQSSEEKVGSGLGLSIVMEIAKKYNWTLEYDFKQKMHHFSVHF